MPTLQEIIHTTTNADSFEDPEEIEIEKIAWSMKQVRAAAEEISYVLSSRPKKGLDENELNWSSHVQAMDKLLVDLQRHQLLSSRQTTLGSYFQSSVTSTIHLYFYLLYQLMYNLTTVQSTL